MASSSSKVSESTSSMQGTSESGSVYKEKTMDIPWKSLIVQIESPVDFASLKKYEVDMESLVETQKLSEYFKMLNGPTYVNLVKDFWLRAEVYNGKPAKVMGKQAGSKKGKMIMDMNPTSFESLEIRSEVMGIPITITENVIAKACRVDAEGRFQEIVKKEDVLLKGYFNTLLGGNKDAKPSEMKIHNRMLVKFSNDCFFQRAGGSDQPNNQQKLAIYFMAILDKINFPRYVMDHLCWAINEGTVRGRKQVPYGRLLSEIFYQGRVVDFLKKTRSASDSCFEVSTAERTISSRSLCSMRFIKETPEDEKWLEMTTAETKIIRDFPSIFEESNPDILAKSVAEYVLEEDASSQEEAAPVKRKKVKGTSTSEAATDKGKQQKVVKRKRGKAETVYHKEKLDEAMDELEIEEAEPKLKKKKAPVDMKISMVELTPAKAKMAKEIADFKLADIMEKKRIRAASIPIKRSKGRSESIITEEHLNKALDGIKAKEHEKKASGPIFTPMMVVTSDMKKKADEEAAQMLANQQEREAKKRRDRDERLKASGLEHCDEFFKKKSEEVKEVAVKASEAVLKAPGATTSEDVKVCQIPVTSTPISPFSPQATEQEEDTSVLENLALHYSGELPLVKPNSEKASEATPEAVASENIVSESPHQQPPEPLKPTSPPQPQSPTANIDPQLNSQTSTSPHQPPTETETNSPLNQQPEESSHQHTPMDIDPDQPSTSTQAEQLTIPESILVQDNTLNDSDLETLEQPPLDILESERIDNELLKIHSEMHGLVDQRRTIDLTNAYEEAWTSLQNRAAELIEAVKAKCIRIKEASVRRLMENLKQRLRVRSPRLLLANKPFFSEMEYLTRDARMFKLLRQKMAKQQQEAKERELELLQKQQLLEDQLKQQAEEMERMRKLLQTKP
jgi:hypothetical protein